MKKSLNLFGKKSNRRRHREDDFIDYDEQYGDEEYSDEEYEDGYDEDDYPDEEFEEQYGRDVEDERYEDEDYPEDERYEDYPEDEEYDRRVDEDYQADEDYDSDYEPERREYDNVIRFEEAKGGRYEEAEDPEYEDEYADGDYAEDDDYDYDREDEYDPEYDDGEYDQDYDEEDYDRGVRGGRGGRRGRGTDGESVGARILEFIRNTSVAERAAAVVAVLLLAGGIAFMTFYSQAKSHVDEVNSFTEVGADLQVQDAVGSYGLLAIADAERARAMTAGILEEEEEEEVVSDTAENVTIKMTLTTIKSDMKIKFINSQSGKLVANVPFTVSVVTPDGTKVSYDDHDKDGIIYKNNLTAGKYTVTPDALSSDYESYRLETSSQSITIKDTVEMKAVDVSNEIKKESQVNAAKEDTAVELAVEGKLENTVEWVESNQDSFSGEGATYEQVDKNNFSGLIIGAALKIGSVKRMAAARATNENLPLSVDPTSVSVEEGKTVTVNASGNTEGLEANSNNNGCATANVSGSTITITGVAEGETTITVTAGGDTASISVKVTKKSEEDDNKKGSIKLSTSEINLEVGAGSKTVQITEGPSEVQCDSKDKTVATVSCSGTTITISPVGKGDTTITVEAGDKYDTASITVKVTETQLKTMTFEPSVLSIKKGTIDAKVTVVGPINIDSCTPVDSSVISIKASGNSVLVTGLKEGSTEVEVSATNFETKRFTVNVTSADKNNMTVSPADKSINLKINDSTTITVSEPTNISYDVDKNDVIKVVKDGTKFNITALATGTAKITFKNEDYNPHELTVTVSSLEELKLKVSKIVLVPGKSYKLETTDSSIKPTYESSNIGVATVDKDNGTIKAVAEGEATITAKYAEKTATVSVKVKAADTVLKDNDGNELFVLKADGTYRNATYADLFDSEVKYFYYKKAKSNDGVRQGWWTIDGKTYYYKKDGTYVTGEQVIQGVKYTFGSDGVRSTSSGTMGIDVSKWNGNINWAQVKKSGVNYAIIRCGYRGSSAGSLIEDPKFKANIQGAQAAGIRVGVYFFSQAVNEVEAVEEASMCINLCKGYNLSMPVYIDVEGSNGRGDQVSASQRTANIKAFCGTIQSAGYKAGVYSNKTWFSQKMNASSLTNYKIWLAQYAASVTYSATRYDMWQYTSKGTISGISGNVDMNILYN